MRTDRLRGLLDSAGPFVSLHFDDSHATHDSARQAESRWSAMHRQLKDSGVPEQLMAAVRNAVLTRAPSVGHLGRLLIAAQDRVLLDERLGVAPPATQIRVSIYPYLLPLCDSTSTQPPHVFAAVDHLGADLTVHAEHGVSVETVVGPGFPVHKPASAGWHGYADAEGSVEESARVNARTVADRITTIVDQIGAQLVFVCGEVRARTDIMSALAPRVRALVVPLAAGAHGGRAPELEFADRLAAEFARRGRAEIDAAVTKIKSELARESGAAVQGLSAVCTALREGAVATLVIGRLRGATVVVGRALTAIAADPDSLSEFGEPPRHTALADEALPFVAVATHASVVRTTDEAGLWDGVGALLRYTPHDSGA